jgi:hypothetical protein
MDIFRVSRGQIFQANPLILILRSALVSKASKGRVSRIASSVKAEEREKKKKNKCVRVNAEASVGGINRPDQQQFAMQVKQQLYEQSLWQKREKRQLFQEFCSVYGNTHTHSGLTDTRGSHNDLPQVPLCFTSVHSRGEWRKWTAMC